MQSKKLHIRKYTSKQNLSDKLDFGRYLLLS